jgi:hypothetical protein
MRTIDALLHDLRDAPARGALFNPWYDRDTQHDRNRHAPGIRRENLYRFLEQRIGRARYLLLGEALGYQGGHFTGIAMTSERILLGGLRERGIAPEVVFRGEHRRTSAPGVKPRGFTEPTATVVWGSIAESRRDPYEFVLWNILPWHPYEPRRGLLSNRTPGRAEIAAGHAALRHIRRLYPRARLIAVGRKAAAGLEAMDLAHVAVRHPAMSGAAQFRRQFRRIVGGARQRR